MDPDLSRYAASRATERGARSYETKYERELHKRISDRVERRVIARALALTGTGHARVLDAPCGAGRLSGEVARHAAGALVELDFSPQMLELCRRNAAGYAPAPVRGDALALPFRDRSFDLVFSARFSHHVASDRDRERWLLELCRVSRRFVVATIFDARSLKNLLRRLRAPFSGKRPKNVLSLERVRELGAGAGFALRAAIPLSRLFSGHRYVVLERGAA